MSKAAGDSLDIAAERAQIAVDARVSVIRANADIEPGQPGICDYCDTWSGRLIKAHCARCRDSLKIH